MVKTRERSLWSIVFSRRMWAVFALGVYSGLPLNVTWGTLQAWMTDAQVDLKVIGLMALVGLPYTLKFLWSPIFDRITLPFLGRRRGWLLVSQIGLALSIFGMSLGRPAEWPEMLALSALFVAFFSASQDAVIDSWRREILPDNELGLGSSLYVYGYRIGMLFTGAGALWLADHIPWRWVYGVTALLTLSGVGVTFLVREPEVDGPPPRNFREAVWEPLHDYFSRTGAVGMLVFILLYKLGDTLASSLSTPFYLTLGFTKTQIAAVVKIYGLFATLLGTFLGGLWMVRIGIYRALWIFGIFQALSTAGFALLSQAGASVPYLSGVIFFENLTGGMGTSAFVAFMASLTNKRFTATQYALLTSLMGVPRVLVSSPAGFMAEAWGWTNYFLFCTVIAIPGLLLLRSFRRDMTAASASTSSY